MGFPLSGRRLATRRLDVLTVELTVNLADALSI